ncbi:MAG: nuclear transport factor 2 family protein [Rhodospirillaceae bacterium]|nr:MAG: nuclear transport factor 2 family protein [Rhodospirillaceae bacterium]
MGEDAHGGNRVNPVDTADRYFAGVRARDLEGLTMLFAQDATFTLPDGRELSGIAAIREMYSHLFAAQAPFPTPVAMVAGTNGVATEIEARFPDGTIRRTANFFHLNNDGLIKRLSVYARSG